MTEIPELLTLGVGIDTSDAEAALAGLGATGAEEAVAGLESKLSGASEGLAQLGKRSSGTSRSIQGLASVVSLVDPRLGQVIRSVGTLARGMSVLRLGLGPAAAAVAAVTAGLAFYQHEQRKAAEEAEAAEARTRDLTEALQAQHDIYLDLQTQVDLVQGSTDRFAIQLEQQRARIEESGRAVTDSYDAEIAALEDKIRVQEEERRVSDEQQAVVSSLKVELAALNQERRDAVSATQSQVVAAEALSEYRREEQASAEFLRQREEARRDAARQRAEQEREAADIARDRQAEEAAYAAMVTEVAESQRDASRALLSEEAQLQAAYQDRLDRLQEISEATQGSIDTAAAEMALRVQLEQDLANIQARRQEDEQARHQAKMEEIQAEANAAREAALERLQVGSDLANSLAGLAAQQFGDSKQAQIAEARLAAILAVVNTLARNPTPLGVAQAAAISAQQIAQIQAMRSVQVTSHRGNLYGDEFMVKARRGEAHLSNIGRQAIGDNNIRRANAGQSLRDRVQVTIQKNRHRPFAEFIDDHLQIGSALSEAINSRASTPTGIRET